MKQCHIGKGRKWVPGSGEGPLTAGLKGWIFRPLQAYFIYYRTSGAGLPRWLSGKDSTCNAGDVRDTGSIPGLGRSPGGEHDNPLQYSCLGNPMDRGAWQATAHRVAKSQTWLNNWTHTHTHIKWKPFRSSLGKVYLTPPRQGSATGMGSRWRQWARLCPAPGCWGQEEPENQPCGSGPNPIINQACVHRHVS